MKRLVILGVCAAAVLGTAGCERMKKTVSRGGYVENGVRYKARATGDREDRANFEVSLKRRAENRGAAAEALRVEATRYCIQQYGTSEMTWTGQSPNLPEEEITLEANGSLVMRGRCKTW